MKTPNTEHNISISSCNCLLTTDLFPFHSPLHSSCVEIPTGSTLVFSLRILFFHLLHSYFSFPFETVSRKTLSHVTFPYLSPFQHSAAVYCPIRPNHPSDVVQLVSPDILLSNYSPIPSSISSISKKLLSSPARAQLIPPNHSKQNHAVLQLPST